jgi:hypothetical protein
MTPWQRAIGTKTIVLGVVAIVLVAALGVVVLMNQVNPGGPNHPVTSTVAITSTTANCSGYPPGGNCPGNYSYTFVISINYTGPWKATYYGYHSVGAYFGQSGNYTGGALTGTGDSSRSITLTGPNTNGLALCARAQKLDASNSTLVLTITGHNETSLPYGSVSYCGGVVP